jgi:signal transduction histidine kinase
MVYNIAQQDGLGVRVTSSPGQGATFRIVIPAHPAGERDSRQ